MWNALHESEFRCGFRNGESFVGENWECGSKVSFVHQFLQLNNLAGIIV